MKWETKRLPVERNYLAPDTSEIRLLPSMTRGGLCHCLLPVQAVSRAVRHKTVEEIWFCQQGQGQVWRKNGEAEETVDVRAGVSLTIPVGTHFQFRNTGSEPLCILIVTMPPWPGEDEAVRVEDHWRPTDSSQHK